MVVSQKIYDPDSVEFEHQTNLCEDPELVADFLENNFVQDALDIYFSQRGMDISLITLDILIFLCLDKNLTLLLSDLSETCIEMLKRPSEIVSAKMQVVATCKVRMHGVSIQAQPRQKLVSHTAVSIQARHIHTSMAWRLTKHTIDGRWPSDHLLCRVTNKTRHSVYV